jgi:perosamine synthetase
MIDRNEGERIPVSQPFLGDEEIVQLTDVIRSGWISSGPKVAAFEGAMAEATGASNAIAVSSGTAALHVALAALGIGPGDEVLVPSLTFISTANAVLYVGATPVLCECDPATFNVTAETLREKVTAKTRAMIPVEMNGIPLNYDEILSFASESGISVIVDSAESLGSAYLGTPVGSQALVHCWSFFPNKTITTGEGGMVTTGDDELAAKIRSLANQAQLSRYQHIDLGYNYRMTEMQAAIGIAQMGRLDWILAEKERLALAYDGAFGDVLGVELPPRPEYATRQSWFMYSISCVDRSTRDAVASDLESDSIETRTGFPPIHTQPYFRERFGFKDTDLRISLKVYERKLDIPCWPGMSEETQGRVIDAIKKSLVRLAS